MHRFWAVDFYDSSDLEKEEKTDYFESLDEMDHFIEMSYDNALFITRKGQYNIDNNGQVYKEWEKSFT